MSTASPPEVRAVKAFMLGMMAASVHFKHIPVVVADVEVVTDVEGIIDHLLLITTSGLRFHLRLEVEET